jgi:hypothetical protein
MTGTVLKILPKTFQRRHPPIWINAYRPEAAKYQAVFQLVYTAKGHNLDF